MTSNERIDRLELALGALAEHITAEYPLRDGQSPGVQALQELSNEFENQRDAAALGRRRRALEAELADLGDSA